MPASDAPTQYPGKEKEQDFVGDPDLMGLQERALANSDVNVNQIGEVLITQLDIKPQSLKTWLRAIVK